MQISTAGTYLSPNINITQIQLNIPTRWTCLSLREGFDRTNKKTLPDKQSLLWERDKILLLILDAKALVKLPALQQQHKTLGWQKQYR